jgi:hypothetical protein
MPETCRFFGIVISLTDNDHPPPHVHVRQADQKAIVAIDSMKARGAEFTMPPTDVTGSKIARPNDTCGNLIQVTQLMRWQGGRSAAFSRTADAM